MCLVAFNFSKVLGMILFLFFSPGFRVVNIVSDKDV